MTQTTLQPPQTRPAARSALIATPARSSLLQRKCACGESSGISGECEACKKKKIQRRAVGRAPVSGVPSIVHEVLAAPGRPLDAHTRGFFEPRFGHDFSGVRIHDDARAAESARAVDAHAYTVGQDIAFASSRYDPHSQAGQRLLAHELGHTIQQRGIPQRSSDVTVPGNVEDQRFEREADAMAAQALSRSGAGRHEPLSATPPASGPVLVREAASPFPNPATPQPPVTPLRTWVELPADSPLRARGITAMQAGDGGIVAFRVRAFPLPATKGPVAALWEARAAAQALEATIEFQGPGVPPRTGLWQSRDRTDDLRAGWLGKLGWTPASAAVNWHQAGGATVAAGAPFRPRVAGTTCQMDHIVELQLGGTNSCENIQVLDPTENQESGRTIWSLVSGLAAAARDSLPDPKPTFVTLHFDTVSAPAAPITPGGCPADGATIPAAGSATSCMQVEACALTRRVAPVAGADSTGRAIEPYPVVSAGARETLQVLPGGQTTDLSGPENEAATQLIAGLELTRLRRTAPASTPDSIEARIDPRTAMTGRAPTRIPATVVGTPGPLLFHVNKQSREMRLQPGGRRPGFDFLYPYLSRGHLDLDYSPADGLSGTGTLTPSLPLLSRAPLTVEFGRGRLRAFYGVAQRDLPTPIPGLRLKEATLGVDLLPEFRPSGRIAFEAGPAGRAVLSGEVNASVDGGGLVFDGTINAQIPGTDAAEGRAHYRNGQWSGFVLIESSKIRIPGVQRGQVRVDFTNAGVVPSGSVDLLVAGNPVTLDVRYHDGGFLFAGRGTFTLAGLEPITASVETDGEHVTARAQTTVRIRGLRGTMSVTYRDGHWSGEGTLPFSAGRARGSVTARLNETGRITGQGSVTYPITDRLTATIGVLLREDQSLRVNGEVRLADIELFQRFPRSGGRQRLFRVAPPDFPIYAIPLGPLGSLGLAARVSLEFGVHYGIGPGVLRNIRATTAFDLFAEGTNFEFEAGAQLYIPFDAGFYVQVDGSVVLGLGPIAEVNGGIGVRGEAGLRGDFTADARLQYRQAKFILDARAALQAHPELLLSLEAFVRASAAAGLYEAEKRWNLASFRFGSDLNFGVAFPFHYDSSEGFNAPSFADIEWIYPRDLNPQAMLARLIS